MRSKFSRRTVQYRLSLPCWYHLKKLPSGIVRSSQSDTADFANFLFARFHSSILTHMRGSNASLVFLQILKGDHFLGLLFILVRSVCTSTPREDWRWVVAKERKYRPGLTDLILIFLNFGFYISFVSTKDQCVVIDFTYFALFSLSSVVDVFDPSSSVRILLPHMSQCHIAHNCVEPSDDCSHGEEDECLKR